MCIEIISFIKPSIAGLLFDVIGVLGIGIAFLFKTSTDIYKQSATYFDYSVITAKVLIAEKHDVIFGTIFLCVGFLLQLVAQFDFSTSKIFMFITTISFSIGIILTLIYLLCLRKIFLERGIANVKKAYEEHAKQVLKEHEQTN
jgi:hypothetical protein